MEKVLKKTLVMKLLVDNKSKITAVGESFRAYPNFYSYIRVSWKKMKINNELKLKDYFADYIEKKTTTYDKTQKAFRMIAEHYFPNKPYEIIAKFKNQE